jgi:S1-C subfamily serine protease
MASGLVIHVSSGEDKHTEVLTDEHIRIGRTEDCDLRLRASDLPRSAANAEVVLELGRTNGFYRVTDFDHTIGITHNGKPLEPDVEIKDGDEVRFHPTELMLTFFPIRSLPAVIPSGPHETHVAPFIEAAAIESAATARRDDAKVFLREFTRELVREINTSTKLITFAIAVALVGGILYIGFALFKEIQTTRRAMGDQSAQLVAQKDEAAKANKQLGELVRSNKDIRDSLSLAVKLRNEYGAGVCLIAGSFYYVEAGSGRPLRDPEAQMNESGAAVQSSGEQTSLTPEGKGPIAEFEFVGSGFYVGQGYVVTNRHIAQPWLADDRAQSMSNAVKGQPRLKKLTAYFPDHPQPYVLKFKQAAPRDDLSVCMLDVKDLPNDIPVLPLESDSGAVAVGNSVVMMGYPSGLDRLLALLDDSESRGIQQRYGSNESLLGHLSETKRIQPLTTQGSITDLRFDVRRIAYDARTAEGGSGAPLFGPSGRVIGVNFAVFTENQASNFAVPIRYAIALLERSGWQLPTEKEGPTEGSGAGQSTTHANPPAPK